SRRRHTRFSRDWSSDVCSSDLSRKPAAGANVNGADVVVDGIYPEDFAIGAGVIADSADVLAVEHRGHVANRLGVIADGEIIAVRSEERRVGKEWLSRWRQNDDS